MSLFISTLSFNDENTLLMAKGAIFMGSFISAIMGVIFIWLSGKKGDKIN